MLSAQPVHLRAAAEALPRATRKAGPEPSIIEFRRLLSKLTEEELAAFQLKKKGRAALLQLLPARDRELRRRVGVLLRRDGPSMPNRLKIQVTPWFPEIGLDIEAQARPRWTTPYAQGGLPPLVQACLERHPNIARLCEWLGLPEGSPLAENLLRAMVEQGSDTWLERLPYTETLRWIERSGAPPGPRRALDARIRARWPDPI